MVFMYMYDEWNIVCWVVGLHNKMLREHIACIGTDAENFMFRESIAPEGGGTVPRFIHIIIIVNSLKSFK